MNRTFTKDDGLPDFDEHDSGNYEGGNINSSGNDSLNEEFENIEAGIRENNDYHDLIETDHIPFDPVHTTAEVCQEIVKVDDNEAANNNAQLVHELTNATQALNLTQTINEPSIRADGVQPKEDTIEQTLDSVKLPNSMEISETTSSSSGSFDNDGNKKERRRTYHVRHNTVNVPAYETIIAKEVASVLNELADTPPEGLMAALQLRLASFVFEKEKECKSEHERSLSKAKALYEMKQTFINSASAATTAVKAPSRPPSPDIDVERLIRERDQYREHASASMRSLREICRQQEMLMDKEKSHLEHIHHIQNEMDEAKNTINELHARYNALIADAEEELLQADVAVDRIRREFDDAILSTRFKVRQQELTLRSLEGEVQRLQDEKKELLDICDDLVARSEVTHTQIPPIFENGEF